MKRTSCCAGLRFATPLGWAGCRLSAAPLGRSARKHNHDISMNIYKEIQPYVALFMTLVSSILAVVLACSAKGLVARGWLIASTAITLATWPAFQVISLVAAHSTDARQIFLWYDVLNLPPLFGTACFGFFLFSNWSRSRMKLDLGNLLFSFSGRISRSAFWVSLCILFPVGTLLGFAPFVTEAGGLIKGIIWTFYAGWFILSIWISLAVYAKRWHDCGRSGWMSLVLLLPIVGLLWFFGSLGFVRGTTGPNTYGDDPLTTPAASQGAAK